MCKDEPHSQESYLLTDKQTDTTEIIHGATSRVVNNGSEIGLICVDAFSL